MRDVPDFLKESTESQIGFTPMDFGQVDSRFETACTNHGDGESFFWLEGGGQHTCHIVRIGRGYHGENERACSVWRVTRTNVATSESEVYVMDSPNLGLVDESGADLPFRQVSNLSDAAIDLLSELAERKRCMQNIIRPIGHTSAFEVLPIITRES